MKMTLSTQPSMIIRTNSEAPEIFLNKEDLQEANLNAILKDIIDPDSIYHVESEYILYRLVDCAKRAMEFSIIPAGYCPMIFDSWSCWNSTSPGSDQYESCPNFGNLGFTPKRLAQKTCTENGTWWIHPLTNRYSFVS